MATRRSEMSQARTNMANDFVMLAKPWKPHLYRYEERNKVDDTIYCIKDWYIEEKFDGVRARWCGDGFYSRSRKRFPTPPEIIELARMELGDKPFDGELSAGRGQFQNTVSIVRNSHSTANDWLNIKYNIFDIVNDRMKCNKRREILEAQSFGFSNFKVSPILGRVTGHEAIVEAHKKMVDMGGEGLIIRDFNAPYRFGRCGSILKVKKFIDIEVLVVGHNIGDGRNAERLGSLICKLPDGRIFKVGTGFTDLQREIPPQVGAIVTVEFFEYTDDGMPRFPVFKGVRDYE